MKKNPGRKERRALIRRNKREAGKGRARANEIRQKEAANKKKAAKRK